MFELPLIFSSTESRSVLVIIAFYSKVGLKMPDMLMGDKMLLLSSRPMNFGCSTPKTGLTWLL